MREHRIVFMPSISQSDKVGLLKSARVVAYTPSEEHFGIVPLEAMYCETPVIAVKSGGPLETIENEETGLLVEADALSFARAFSRFVLDGSLSAKMGSSGRQRVIEKFSLLKFGLELETVLLGM